MQRELFFKTVNAWDVIQPSESSVCLIGFSYTGRTTFAQLLNKYQFKKAYAGLMFEKDKYTFDNVISAKSIRLQTTLPAVYRGGQGYTTTSKGGDHLAVIDVPSFCLTPDTKKWSPLEQKLTSNLMFQHTKKSGFLLFIEQKNTRTFPSLWKRTIYGFLQMFKQFPDQLLNSVGWMIMKCDYCVSEQIMSKRLRLMQTALKQDNIIDPAIIDKLFNNIVENSRIYIFRKFCGNQKLEEEEIRYIYKDLTQITNYTANKAHLQEQNWSEDEQNFFRERFQICDQSLAKMINLINQALTHPQWLTLPKLIQDAKKKYYSSINPGEILIRQDIRKRLNGRAPTFDPSQFIKAFKEIKDIAKTYISDKERLDGLVDLLIKFPIFMNAQDQVQLQAVQEAISFKNLTGIKFIFSKTIEAIDNTFLTNRNQFYTNLNEIALENDTQAFYESVIELLESDRDHLSKQANSFLEHCKENIMKFKPSQKILQKMNFQLGQKEPEIETIVKIPGTLEKQQYIQSASKIDKLLKCPQDDLKCMEKSDAPTKSEAKQQITHLSEMCLVDATKKSCQNEKIIEQ